MLLQCQDHVGTEAVDPELLGTIQQFHPVAKRKSKRLQSGGSVIRKTLFDHRDNRTGGDRRHTPDGGWDSCLLSLCISAGCQLTQGTLPKQWIAIKACADSACSPTVVGSGGGGICG
jgi:hypothetical protein